MPNNSDYEIGYRKPPEATRFKKGRSGNPQGRPKKEKETLGTLMEMELQAKVGIVENGKRKKSSKAQAMIKQIVNKAVGGDPRSIAFVLKATGASIPERAAKYQGFQPPPDNSSEETVRAKLFRLVETYRATHEKEETAAESDQAKSELMNPLNSDEGKTEQKADDEPEDKSGEP